ncbi:MAG: hypothetical protein OXF79_11295 [Chloroflexi bacterium]|nr:hypothetical protein [Chloroflexota bacterium]
MINRITGIRKRWFVVAASVALLAVGLTFGSVFASGSDPTDILKRGGHSDQRGGGHFGNNDTVLNRVAELLGKTRAELDSAFATSLDEQANTKFEERMTALVTDETLTQDQADAANTWFDERPSNSGAIAIRLAGTSDTDKVDTRLAKLVEAEKLTQDESDDLSDWHDDRPDSLPTVSHKHSGGRHGHHGDGDSDS